MEQDIPNASVALIVGVTGMAGLALAEALSSPKSLGAPWKVYGAARRPMPTWFPSSSLHKYLSFDALNLHETSEILSPISHEISHVFWVAIQVRENEEANVTANKSMLENVISVLKSAKPCPRLCHITLQTGTKHYMGPIFDPVLGTQMLVHHETPFQEESARLPYPNFYYDLEDLVASFTNSFSYSVHRSSIIVGASSRSAYNALLTLAVYATICRYEGLPFRFPGTKYTWEHFGDMSDARVLAEQHIWAAVTEGAKNQAFNCTNGDIFAWKSLWKILCDIFEVAFEPFDNETEGFDWVGMMKQKGSVWDEIVEKHGLYKTKLEEIACFEALNTVLHFRFQHVSSMNKSREFGFCGFANTLESMKMWVGRLRAMKIIP